LLRRRAPSQNYGGHAGVLGLAGLGVYFAWERVSAHPMTPPRLGQNGAFVGLNTATLACPGCAESRYRFHSEIVHETRLCSRSLSNVKQLTLAAAASL
jgi:hypothetical protein